MLLDAMLQKKFEQEKMPDEWRDSVIVPIFKEKGYIQDCGKYRVIKIRSYNTPSFIIIMKIFGKSRQ